MERPCTKIDPESLGNRILVCLCGDQFTKPCACRALAAQSAELAAKFSDSRVQQYIPLFPSEAGEAGGKKKVAKLLEHVTQKTGLPVTRPVGRNLCGVHQLRVSEAH